MADGPCLYLGLNLCCALGEKIWEEGKSSVQEAKGSCICIVGYTQQKRKALTPRRDTPWKRVNPQGPRPFLPRPAMTSSPLFSRRLFRKADLY
jgi:hypothetical protein